jgi:hypothetical protein
MNFNNPDTIKAVFEGVQGLFADHKSWEYVLYLAAAHYSSSIIILQSDTYILPYQYVVRP